MSMEESPQKPQVSAYNPTQGAPSLRATTTTTPGAGLPARPPPRPSGTPGRQRRGEEEEDEEEPTVALEVAPQVHQISFSSTKVLASYSYSLWHAPQPVARRRVGLRRSALQRRNAEETDGPAPCSSIVATTSLVRTTASASAASTTTQQTKGFRSPLLKSFNSPLTAWCVLRAFAYLRVIAHLVCRTTKQFCFPDAEVCHTLNTSASGPPTPQVTIPDYFTSLDEYR